MSQINYMTYKFDSLATTSDIITFFETLLTNPLVDWTKEDEYIESSSGLTVLVFSSRGAAGDRPKAYVLIRIYDTNTVNINIAQYYDSITNVILNAIYSDWSYILKLDSYFLAEIWGNKDYVYMFTSRDTWYGRTMFGFIPDVLNQYYTQLTAPVSQGTEVTLEVQDSSLFKISDYYQFIGAGEGLTGEGCDWGIQVLDIPDTNHILVNDVPRDYSIGSYFGVSPLLFGIRVVDNIGEADFKVIGARTIVGIQQTAYGWYRANSILISNESYLESDSASQTGVMQPMFMTERSYPVGDSESIVAIPHGWLTGDRRLYSSNPTGDRVTFAYLEQPEPIIGTATSSGLNTLTDTSQNWQVDELINKFIHINIHEEDEQIAKIISNTSDTITVDVDWYNTIDVGYPYYVADELYRNPFEHYGSHVYTYLAIYNLTRLN